MGENTGRVRAALEPWRAWTLALATVAGAFLLLSVAVLRVGAGPPVIAAAGYVAVVTLPLSVIDLRQRRLPNALVFPGFAFAAAGLVWQGFARGSPPGAALAEAVMAAAAVFVAFWMLNAFGGLGMGDVKLAAVLALALAACGLGPRAIGLCVGVAFVTAGLAASAALVLRRLRWLRWRRSGPAPEVPFGPFLLAGFWAAIAVAGKL